MTAKPAEQFSANYFKPREYDHEKGRNVHVQIVIERHGDPQKDPLTGKSLDALTEKGVREEREKGATLEVPAGGVKGYASPKKRTQQSADLQLEGLEDSENAAHIINLKLKDIEKPQATYPNKDATFTPFIIREKRELDVLTFDPKFYRAMAFQNPEEQDESKLIKHSYDELVQYYLDHADSSGTTLPPEDVAALLAYRVGVELGMVLRLKDSSDVLLKNLTHAPNADAFLQQVMLRDVDGRQARGFQNVAEIGGAIKPMVWYTIDARTDENGDLALKLILRGQEYGIDEERLRELAKRGKELLKPKGDAA